VFEAAGEELVKTCETNEDEAEDAQNGRCSWIPLQTYWHHYRNFLLKSYNRKLPRQWGNEARHGYNDAVVVARASGVECTVVGPIPNAMQTTNSSIMLS